MLTVEVTDSSNKPVAALTQENFTVLDNHKPQKIAVFHEVDGSAASAGVHGIVVLDGINDGGSAVGRVKKDLGKFLSQSKAPLTFPLSLVFVSEGGATESEPSTDRGVLAAQLAQMARLPHSSDCGRTGSSIEGSRIQQQPNVTLGTREQDQADCVNSHLLQSISALRDVLGEQANVRGRGILVWAGSGWPMVAEYSAEPAAGNHRGNFRDILVELTTNLREAQVTLDAISWGDFEHPKNIRKPILSADASVPFTPDQIAEESMSLPALAQSSGGQAVARTKDFADAFAAFLADADRFYELSFDSVPSAAPDEFHSIEVKVDRPGVTVRTSTAYFAQP